MPGGRIGVGQVADGVGRRGAAAGQPGRERRQHPLDGEDLTAASPARMQEAARRPHGHGVPGTHDPLNPLMRVGRQIAEVLQVHRPDLGAGQVRARVLELMGDVHLPTPEALMDAFPHQLSGGQRQRIMIAMALALEPAEAAHEKRNKAYRQLSYHGRR